MGAELQILILTCGLVVIGAILAVAIVMLLNQTDRLRGRAERAERLLHYRRPVPHLPQHRRTRTGVGR